jgi:hypothetical protein
MENVSPAELFPHVRVVLGTIVGLGITRLLMTVAGMIQHPGRSRVSVVHCLWILSIGFEIVLFWWWEFSLFRFQNWSFTVTLFLILYAVTLFLLAALLSPDHIQEYKGYEDFFIRRRHWFFALFALTFVLDTIDTYIKNSAGHVPIGSEFMIQIPFGLILCLLAIRFKNRNLQLAIVLIHLAYQIFLTTTFLYRVQ